jgi:uncharacterized repeat protein (TIGR03847 family)
MNQSFDFDEVESFTTGTVGPPGQRVFYLQARAAAGLLTLRLEKQLVAALVARLVALLADLPPTGPVAAAPELTEPVVDQWIVGALGVSYDEVDDRFVLLADELVDEEAGEEGATARLRITREQATAFVAHGAQVVAAGRPSCPLCGGPIDPEGHVCPRSNGHRPLTR